MNERLTRNLTDDFKQTQKGNPGKSLWRAQGAIALALVAILLPACNNVRQPEATAPDTGTVTTEDVADRTEQLIGKTVTVRSEPVRQVGANAFIIEDERFFGNESILVVNATGQPLPVPIDAETELQVTGEVRNFVISEVGQQNNLPLQADLFREYENKPAIIARSIAPAPAPGEISNNPQQYYGKSIAVAGEVDAIEGASIFKLEERQLLGANELLVINVNSTAAQQQGFKDGETVAVTGVLRPFVIAEIEQQYGTAISRDALQQLEAEYKNKPVLIAEGVYPSAVSGSAQ